MIDNRLNSEIAAKLWAVTAEFLKRKGCKDRRHRNSYMLYLYASGKTMNEIAEEFNLTRERVRQILVGEINSMTRSARMNGYFALQERYERLQAEYETLSQRYEVLQNVAKKNITKFVSLKDFQRDILGKDINEMGFLPIARRSLRDAGFDYIWQIVKKSEKELLANRFITPTLVKKIKEYLAQYGLHLDMRVRVDFDE